ncbi:MAG: hypothetical protein EOO03_05525 [Chitinophagaceae bacterium]|nr:MAG: hypothetical protein EOO03_05525 [Chitinophagaceae bacterium]
MKYQVCSGMFIRHFLLVTTFIALSAIVNAQTSFDKTDSLANIANQFVIRFDVATGNIYMPVKKKIYTSRKNSEQFSLHPFRKKDSKPTILYRDVLVNGQVTKQAYDTVSKSINEYAEAPTVLFTRGTRMLRPRVGSFIRLIFENVPKHTDVFANMEFVDKNMENASMAEGFLNSYAAALKEGVKADTTTIIREIHERMDSVINKANEKTTEQKETTKISSKQFDYELQKMDASLTNLKTFSKGKNENPDISELVEQTKNFVTDLRENLKDSSLYRKDTLLYNNISARLKKLDSITNTTLKKTITFDSAKIKLQQMVDILGVQTRAFFGETQTYLATMESIHKNMREQIDSLQQQLGKIKDSLYSRRTVYMQPIQVQNSDLSVINLTFRSDKKSESDIHREITLKNKYGFKLDFSTGFLGTGLVDSNYKVLRAPNTGGDTSYIVPDSRGSFAVGFALLAHAYFRTGNRVNFAINTGLMLNGSNQTINYLTGLSVPLGLEQRFIISGGVAFGKVKRLVNYYTTKKMYAPSELSLASTPVTEKWDRNWYLGVSYNLSSLTKGKRNVVIAKP